MKEIINLLKDMELEKISPKEVLLKIEDILNFEFDEYNHTYKLPDGTIIQIKIENDFLFVEYGEDIYCKNFKSDKPLYKLYWESSSELKEHGNFNSIEDAYNAISKWWEKNNFKPNYVRLFTGKFKGSKINDTIIIDYGPYYSFYKIKKMDGTEIENDLKDYISKNNK